MNLWTEFHGPNAGYVMELYERYLQNPASVDAQTRVVFDQWRLAEPVTAAVDGPKAPPLTIDAGGVMPVVSPTGTASAGYALSIEKATAVQRLAQAIRWYGHFGAQLDPLGSPPPGDPALALEYYQLQEEDLSQVPPEIVGGPAADWASQHGGTAREAIQYLRQVYSTNVGHDYLQIRNPEERDWLRQAAESNRFGASDDPAADLSLLERLTQVEVFEQFLQRSFVAKTRFSIEGLDMMVPMLDELAGSAAQAGIFNILIGMAHRGRLNVLAHILEKPYDQILAEFKDPLLRQVMQNEPTGWTGDVKYHAGGSYTRDDHDPATIDLTIHMAPNPSHLEAVNPVVVGMARAAGTQADQRGPARFNPEITLPVLIHGDAAFPGQGVVAETLNMHRLNGYSTGGTIHIIANNQVGFTTDPYDSRSTLFASDLAKGFRVPILHVNADDPHGCLMAMRLAFAYRQHFGRDFLIDLIGYRRLGHNEGDEPAFTQPLVYQKIEKHPTVRQHWAETLEARGELPAGRAQQLVEEKMAVLAGVLEKLDPEALRAPIPEPAPPGAARSANTGLAPEKLIGMHAELSRLPDGFTLHPRLARIRQRRDKMMDDPNWPSIDWATAEELAMASILADGTPIRLTGQDVERGTFSHRHAVLHDVNTNQTWTPLQQLSAASAAFEIYNSPLSETAALGFEFGYNIQTPERLVIWEAQYGDFINNAQSVIDEFIVSARDKWGQLPSLVILLPHGYEGQGPDHSSARLERFLNLAADNNLRVANCTTAAQYYHLLRRQAALLKRDPLPLVVMTPKSILRHPLVASSLHDLAAGRWQPILDRQPAPNSSLPPASSIRRLVLCSGKVYIDLLTSELMPEHPEVGVARVEQLAPFPVAALRELLTGYTKLDELVWLQEEPENMGAWEFVRPYLEKALAGRCPLRLVARPRSASPSEGSNAMHIRNQRRLVEMGLKLETNSEQLSANSKKTGREQQQRQQEEANSEQPSANSNKEVANNEHAPDSEQEKLEHGQRKI